MSDPSHSRTRAGRGVSGPSTVLPLAIAQIRFDAGGDSPLYMQLEAGIRGAIARGSLHQGDALPTVRDLASSLALSRNTVLGAYRRLAEEGLIEGHTGRGTRVTAAPPPGAARQGAGSQGDARPPRAVSAGRDWVAPVARKLLLTGPIVHTGDAFTLRLVDFALFPRHTLGRYLAEEARLRPVHDYRLDVEGGHPKLRAAIAQFLLQMRGVECSPDSVVITVGTLSTFDVLSRLLLAPGRIGWVSDPEYATPSETFMLSGATIRPLFCDAAGEQTPPGSPGVAHVIALNAECHPITGARLGLARRKAFLEWASASDAVVVENDSDWAFAFGGVPATALHTLDADGRVVYIGSFLQTIGLSFRVGFAVLPAPLAQPFREFVRLFQYAPQSFVQAALARFIANGDYAAHLKRIRSAYNARATALTDALQRHFPRTGVQAPNGGLHVTLPLATSDVAAARAAAARDLVTTPLSSLYRHTPNPPQGLLLGFGALHERKIVERVAQLAGILRDAGAV